jgi:hypothetical protein
VVDKVALGQVFLSVLGCPLSASFPPMIHTHSLVCHRRYIVYASLNSTLKTDVRFLLFQFNMLLHSLVGPRQPHVMVFAHTCSKPGNKEGKY